MSENTLKEAMRLGSQNPKEERNPKDLGKFFKRKLDKNCNLIIAFEKERN